MRGAVARGWVDAVADPALAIQAVAKLDPLTPIELELKRLRYVIEHHIVTPATRAGGLGAFDRAKLERTIALIAEGFELPRATGRATKSMTIGSCRISPIGSFGNHSSKPGRRSFDGNGCQVRS
ncbi:MAG: hypothetical protein WDO24_13720 [Pseudomonadota bacterium]